MEREQIIPTDRKAKIPQRLSYPIGAKEISDALVGVPQFSELSLVFSFWKFASYGTATPYPVIRVQYSRPVGYYSPKWSLSVNAIPRPLRHVIHDKVITEALPLIRSWLLANPHSTQREGRHALEFTFDELKGELRKDDTSSVTWQTTRVGRESKVTKASREGVPGAG